MGKQVAVLEAAPRVLARVAAAETSALAEQTLRENGVELRTNWGSVGFGRAGDHITQIHGEGSTIAADLILVGIGASAAIELAECAGIARKVGIVTDAALAASAPHVWAIGDVAETPHWQTKRAERLESRASMPISERTFKPTTSRAD
jgi:3-phenylpropionate/trans-cinnamate dioxygenase ferredoxin reductase component